jgi:hypothetical protein
MININTFTKNSEEIEFVNCALSCKFGLIFRVCYLKITPSMKGHVQVLSAPGDSYSQNF